MNNQDTQARNIALSQEYYRRLDGGQNDLLDLFADDFQFFFPKFGIGVGKKKFIECAMGLGKAVPELRHNTDHMLFRASGDDFVTVEGTTAGSDAAGNRWAGGETPGGRFCSVFEFAPDGLITRMHIYLDPDYTSQDGDRFLWGHDRTW